MRVIASVTELQPLTFFAWHAALKIAALSLRGGLANTTKTDMSGLHLVLHGTRPTHSKMLVFILWHERGIVQLTETSLIVIFREKHEPVRQTLALLFAPNSSPHSKTWPSPFLYIYTLAEEICIQRIQVTVEV